VLNLGFSSAAIKPRRLSFNVCLTAQEWAAGMLLVDYEQESFHGRLYGKGER
jgi:hypothetical protein